MPDRLEPIRVFISAFGIASVGGLAALLRSNKPITWRTVLSATLYSGMFGLVIALLWYNYFDGQGNIYFLLGVSGLAGIGGTTVLDFLITTLKKGGIHIAISPGDEPKKPRQEGDDDVHGT